MDLSTPSHSRWRFRTGQNVHLDPYFILISSEMICISTYQTNPYTELVKRVSSYKAIPNRCVYLILMWLLPLISNNFGNVLKNLIFIQIYSTLGPRVKKIILQIRRNNFLGIQHTCNQMSQQLNSNFSRLKHYC